jgi:CDP-4-dehydro-6-deoxyglucose reductase
MFFLREESNAPAILIGGGTGFAPIKSILEHAFARGLERPLHFYWGARARCDLYLHDLVQSWVDRHKNFRYTPVLSEPAPDDRWTGRTGWVHEAVLADHADLTGREVYASGPPPMIDAIKQSFFARGLPLESLYYDSFEHAHAR